VGFYSAYLVADKVRLLGCSWVILLGWQGVCCVG
jgi:hypothetical protein